MAGDCVEISQDQYRAILAFLDDVRRFNAELDRFGQELIRHGKEMARFAAGLQIFAARWREGE